jgi:hypothetical protein
MNMKFKAGGALIGAAVLINASSAFASLGTGTLSITAPNYNGPSGTGDQAGPYTVTSLTVSTGVVPVGTAPNDSFQTFCLGSQIDFTPPASYHSQISDTVQPAGPAPGGVGAPGYVTWGTAWLYSQFRAGTLSGLTHITDNDALQVAIWTLQNQSLSGISFGTGANLTTIQNDATALENFVATQAGKAGVSDTSDAAGAFGVYALNMYTGTSTSPSYVQPELVLVPVPEPATVLAGALVALPLGLSVVRSLRKERKA